MFEHMHSTHIFVFSYAFTNGSLMERELERIYKRAKTDCIGMWTISVKLCDHMMMTTCELYRCVGVLVNTLLFERHFRWLNVHQTHKHITTLDYVYTLIYDILCIFLDILVYMFARIELAAINTIVVAAAPNRRRSVWVGKTQSNFCFLIFI